MEFPTTGELEVTRLGEPRFDSPLLAARPRLAEEHEPILLSSTKSEILGRIQKGEDLPAFEPAGPRRRLFFDRGASAAILTCGGLCPGLNNVIRAITLTLYESYGVKRVLGIRFGYRGLAEHHIHTPYLLDPTRVEDIHEHGGTVLASSRGGQDIDQMVDQLVELGVDMLFAIGGDGTLRGAEALARRIGERELEISVIGIPKTIDNDLHWIERSFGFATAVEEAERVIDSAHAEATGGYYGIGLVKLMGRHAGFIAAHATLSNSAVDFCLVPEVPFDLEGERGLVSCLERRLRTHHHAVVVVAEGAGQNLLDPITETDASGNRRLGDIGLFLKKELPDRLRERGLEPTLKYIDPSYIIRSRRANSIDSELCLVLGQHAVHAAMSGRTNLMVGCWNRHYIHVPIPLAVVESRLDPAGEAWLRVLESTGQPSSMRDRPFSEGTP